MITGNSSAFGIVQGDNVAKLVDGGIERFWIFNLGEMIQFDK